MKFEFLIKGDSVKTQVEKLRLPKDCLLKIGEIRHGNEFYSVSLSCKGNSLSAAYLIEEQLAQLEGLNYRVLYDGPSKKYASKLYGPIAEFERRIRKLVTICLNHFEESSIQDLITELEEMDFGKLFEKLFTDREFNNEVRQLINKKDHIFEKQELLNNLHNIKENSIWSRYFKDDNLNVVTKKHHEIRTIRNKVMHSKKLTHEEYIYSKKLLSDANDELEKEIANRVKYGNEKSFDYSGLAKSLKLQFFVNDEVFTSLTDNFQNAMSEYYGKVHSDAFEQYLKAFSSSMLSSYWNTASSDNKIERKDGDEEEAENSNQKE